MNVKSSFSKDFLDEIAKQLEEQRLKLENELGQFTKKSQHVADDFDTQFPEYGDKEDENAAEVAEYINNLPVEEGLEKTLRDVNKAMERIEKGTYGVCKYCGKAIEEKRLLARPTSSACVECKKTITQEL
ncbi:MAG: TraR/DksA C4-type zinc finger protein [Candidatus Magasanikbacteria bacterium]|nr:TraR/DksA C4-type zinc finger protein [Candidatus Magasanikbacteria bacterium]